VKFTGVRDLEGYRSLAQECVFQGKVVGVSIERFVLPDGREARHEVLHLPAAVCVVPILESPGERARVVLVDQFRNSVEGCIHEIPAGILEEGEEPARCAARELAEETGYRAGRITHLTTLFPIPGTSAHRMYFYLAEDLVEGPQKLEASEFLEVKRYDFDALVASLVSGLSPASGDALPCIVDAKTHVGLLHVAARRNALGAGSRK
jgi:ADP-ribose pyrophosphatase